jgi:hypothetical protein
MWDILSDEMGLSLSVVAASTVQSFSGMNIFLTPPTGGGQVPVFISPKTGWPSYTPRHWGPFSSPPTACTAMVEEFEPASIRGFGFGISPLGRHLRKQCFQQFFYCCVYISVAKKTFTEPLPSNGRQFRFFYSGFDPSCHCIQSKLLSVSLNKLHINIKVKAFTPNFCPHIHYTSTQMQWDYRNTALWRDLVLAAANVELRHAVGCLFGISATTEVWSPITVAARSKP